MKKAILSALAILLSIFRLAASDTPGAEKIHHTIRSALATHIISADVNLVAARLAEAHGLPEQHKKSYKDAGAHHIAQLSRIITHGPKIQDPNIHEVMHQAHTNLARAAQNNNPYGAHRDKIKTCALLACWRPEATESFCLVNSILEDLKKNCPNDTLTNNYRTEIKTKLYHESKRISKLISQSLDDIPKGSYLDELSIIRTQLNQKDVKKKIVVEQLESLKASLLNRSTTELIKRYKNVTHPLSHAMREYLISHTSSRPFTPPFLESPGIVDKTIDKIKLLPFELSSLFFGAAKKAQQAGTRLNKTAQYYEHEIKDAALAQSVHNVGTEFNKLNEQTQPIISFVGSVGSVISEVKSWFITPPEPIKLGDAISDANRRMTQLFGESHIDLLTLDATAAHLFHDAGAKAQNITGNIAQELNQAGHSIAPKFARIINNRTAPTIMQLTYEQQETSRRMAQQAGIDLESGSIIDRNRFYGTYHAGNPYAHIATTLCRHRAINSCIPLSYWRNLLLKNTQQTPVNISASRVPLAHFKQNDSSKNLAKAAQKQERDEHKYEA